LVPTEAGSALAAWLMDRFPSVVSENAVTDLDLDLDRIAAGERGRVDVVRAFWERLGADARPTESAPEPMRTVAEHKPVVLRPVEEG
jgi:DNA topoisomerase IA